MGAVGAPSSPSSPVSSRKPGFPPHSLTVLSRPSVISIRKKMMAKKVDAGMLAMASAYVMKRRLGPETERETRGRGHRHLPCEDVSGETQPHQPLQLWSRALTRELGFNTCRLLVTPHHPPCPPRHHARQGGDSSHLEEREPSVTGGGWKQTQDAETGKAAPGDKLPPYNSGPGQRALGLLALGCVSAGTVGHVN